MYGSTFLSLTNFVEEAIPGTDFIPTATIGTPLTHSQTMNLNLALL